MHWKGFTNDLTLYRELLNPINFFFELYYHIKLVYFERKIKDKLAMLSSSYTDYMFQVKGESIKQKPASLFEAKAVYLIIDKELKTIWIWAGSKSKLFHRYMASSWAGKLKSRKEYYEFKYEVIKQGSEPDDFIIIFNEIHEGRTDLSYPGESRVLNIDSKKLSSSEKKKKKIDKVLSNSERAQIKNIISEINEIQMHIKYSMEHIGKRIAHIEKIINQ